MNEEMQYKERNNLYNIFIDIIEKTVDTDDFIYTKTDYAYEIVLMKYGIHFIVSLGKKPLVRYDLSEHIQNDIKDVPLVFENNQWMVVEHSDRNPSSEKIILDEEFIENILRDYLSIVEENKNN